MTLFSNRVVAPSVGGSRCVPLPGMVLPKGLGSGQLFLGSSRSRVFVISARPNLAGGFGPRPFSSPCLTEHKP
jgi:hypothetical protein